MRAAITSSRPCDLKLHSTRPACVWCAVRQGYLKRTEEMPVHPGLSSKKKWQISTVLTKEELRERVRVRALGSCLVVGCGVGRWWWLR